MNKFQILALVIVTLDVCVAFLVKNDNGSYNKTSLQDGHSSASQSIQDLMTLLVEEKRLRFQLEDRLNNIENKMNQVDLFHNEVTKELLKERSNRQQLETTYFNLKMELDNLTNICDIAKDESFENDLKIANLSTSLKAAKDQISVLANHTAVIDQQIGNSPVPNGNRTFDGFSVKMTSQSFVATYKPLHAYNVIYNDGGFDADTDAFVCRQPGFYFFTFSLVQSHKGSISSCCLYKNSFQSSMTCAIAGNNTSIQYSTGTVSGVLSLKKGDRVYVGDCSDPQDIDGNTNFTGFLIEPK